MKERFKRKRKGMRMVSNKLFDVDASVQVKKNA